MTVDSQRDIEGLMAAGRAVRAAFERMRAAARPGVSTLELDAIGAACLAEHGAQSAPRLFYDFPGATCISVNEEAAHGVPSARRLESSDMINIDVSAELDGYVADMGESFVVGEASPEQAHLCAAVRQAVTEALAEVRSGRPLNVIGAAVQRVADAAGYHIVANLGSHGVGRAIHEAPSYVPRDNPAERRVLADGLVLTVEPFFSTAPGAVSTRADGWTLAVPAGQLVAQYEQTFIVTRAGALLVTA